jgi:hypothetical protein
MRRQYFSLADLPRENLHALRANGFYISDSLQEKKFLIVRWLYIGSKIILLLAKRLTDFYRPACPEEDEALSRESAGKKVCIRL